MSFDLAVFFNTLDSPKEIILPVLHELGETGPEDDSGYWFTAIDDSSLHFRIVEIVDPEQPGHSLGFKWRFDVYANSGCSPTARWAQFSVLYLCLALLDGSAAHDPQSDQTFTSPENFREHASRCISRWPGLARKLRRLDLMTVDSKLVLDRPAE